MGKPSFAQSYDVIGNIIDDIIITPESYISKSAEFHDIQHNYISMNVHQFANGLCTDPSG